jgi:hypothetical protein
MSSDVGPTLRAATKPVDGRSPPDGDLFAIDDPTGGRGAARVPRKRALTTVAIINGSSFCQTLELATDGRPPSQIRTERCATSATITCSASPGV